MRKTLLMLLFLGASAYSQVNLKINAANELKDSVKVRRFTTEYVLDQNNLIESQQQHFIESSKQLANSDLGFGQGPEFAKRYIRQNLGEKQHLERGTHTNYDESWEQILEIENPYIIFKLKKYIDYFDTKQAKNIIKDMLKEEGESGAFILNEQSEIYLQQLENTAGDKKDFFAVPDIPKDLPYIGMLHTHNDNKEPENYAGPSRNDIRLFRGMQLSDPFSIDVVVTEIDSDSYNIDAYFSDVNTTDETPVPSDKVTVIDLGIYK